MSLTAGSSPASAEEVGIATEAFESSARWASGIVCSMISTLSPHPSVAQGDADPSFSELASSRACTALARAQKSRLKVIALRTCRWSGHADCRRTRPDATLDRPRSAVEHIPTVSQGRRGDGRGDVIVSGVRRGIANENSNHKRRFGKRLRGKIRHRLRRWGNSGFSQVKSSQFVDKVTSTDVLANHLRAFSNYFSDSPTPAPSSG